VLFTTFHSPELAIKQVISCVLDQDAGGHDRPSVPNLRKSMESCVSLSWSGREPKSGRKARTVFTMPRRIANPCDQLDAAAEIHPEARAEVRSALLAIEAVLTASRANDKLRNLSESLRHRFSKALERYLEMHSKLTATVGRSVDSPADLRI